MTEETTQTTETTETKTEDHGIDTSESLLDGSEGEGDTDGALPPVDFTKGRPENFPEDAWDETSKAPKADVLFKKLQDAEDRAKGLRDKLAKGSHKAPKDVKEYAYKPSEKGVKLFKDGDASKDPLIQAAAPIAHKYGISKEAFQGFMSDMTDTLADLSEKAANEAPPEMSAEEKKEAKETEYKKIGGNAPQIIRAVESWAREMKTNGIMSEADVAAFKSMAFGGEQVRVLNILRSMINGGQQLPMGADDDGLPSDEEIAKMQDEVKDQAGQDKLDALYEKRRRAGRPEKLQFKG